MRWTGEEIDKLVQDPQVKILEERLGTEAFGELLKRQPGAGAGAAPGTGQGTALALAVPPPVTGTALKQRNRYWNRSRSITGIRMFPAREITASHPKAKAAGLFSIQRKRPCNFC